MPADPQRIQDLFLRLVGLPPADRPAALDRECGSDPAVRQRVAALLQAHDEPDSYLDGPSENLAATMDSQPAGAVSAATGEHTPDACGSRDAAVPRTLTTDYRRDGVAGVVIGGRYTLQEKIGEGGMGEVWVAKQTEPVKRKVALKLIKTGMDSRAVLQRFEQERQALALMDHPHIARVLDGGMTPTGQPFFVMELVNGLPLNKFCDELKLTLKQRLELFVPICQAVQHAHQKGIVHRDLKPANILVTMIDGKPVPKVIDFGVAKATSGKLTEETMSTGFGAVVGTLEYMSPEQAGFSGEDIDTRADIYSLGVILYELLTGLRPIDAKRLRKAALTEMIRIIQEEAPSKPSTRLSTDESLPSLAAVRQTEPKKLTALLRGELDWVVMKCLEKQRDRRYETANGLARDIQRYLADEVVEARPPSTGYRLKKFVKRNKGQVVAASLGLLALLVGMAGATWGLMEASQKREAQRQRQIAERMEALSHKAAEDSKNAKQAAIVNAQEAGRLKEIAIEESKRAQQAKHQAEEEQNRSAQYAMAVELAKADQAATLRASEILGSIFENLDEKELAKKERSLRVILVEKLDETAAQLEGKLIDDPGAYAITHYKIGKWLMRLGEPGKAIVLLEKVRAAWHAKLGPDHPETLTSIRNLATACLEAGQGAKAAPIIKEFIVGQRKRYPKDDPALAGLLEEVTLDLLKCNQFAEAEPLFRECLASREKTQPDTWMTFNTHSLLGGALLGQKKYADAEPLLLAGYEGMKQREKTIPPQSKPCLPESLDRLIELYTETNKLDEVQKWQAERAKYPPAATAATENK